MNRWIVFLLVAASAFVVGCEEPQKQGGATPTGSTAAAAPVQLKDDDLPTPADFDDEAEKQITSANYKTELDALEKEISAE